MIKGVDMQHGQKWRDLLERRQGTHVPIRLDKASLNQEKSHYRNEVPVC